MQRRTLIRTAAAAPLLVSPAVRPAHAAAPDGVGDGAGVVWQRLFPAPANFPVLDGTPIRFPISLARSARRSVWPASPRAIISWRCSAASRAVPRLMSGKDRLTRLTSIDRLPSKRPPPRAQVHLRAGGLDWPRGHEINPHPRDGDIPGPARHPEPRRASGDRRPRCRCRHYPPSPGALFCGDLLQALCHGDGPGRREALFDHCDGRDHRPFARISGKAFSEFFLGAVREVYPRYGFATMSEAEFGATIRLE